MLLPLFVFAVVAAFVFGGKTLAGKVALTGCLSWMVMVVFAVFVLVSSAMFLWWIYH